MSTLSLDEIDAYPGAVSSSSDVEGNAQAVRTLIDAGYLAPNSWTSAWKGPSRPSPSTTARGTAAPDSVPPLRRCI